MIDEMYLSGIRVGFVLGILTTMLIVFISGEISCPMN